MKYGYDANFVISIRAIDPMQKYMHMWKFCIPIEIDIWFVCNLLRNLISQLKIHSIHFQLIQKIGKTENLFIWKPRMVCDHNVNSIKSTFKSNAKTEQNIKHKTDHVTHQKSSSFIALKEIFWLKKKKPNFFFSFFFFFIENNLNIENSSCVCVLTWKRSHFDGRFHAYFILCEPEINFHS